MATQFNRRTGGRGIEWTDRTENPVGGCVHDCRWEMPDGTVAICYAKEVAEGVARVAYDQGFEHHYWRPEKLLDLVRGKEPNLIFCDSMSDLFGAGVPEEHTRAVLRAMREAPHHAYQSLTKAPGRLLKFVDDLPPNLWVGVSTPPDWLLGERLERGQQVAMLRKSLDVLRRIRDETGNLVWLSAEPVSWDIAGEMPAFGVPLDWIVIGAASRGNRYYQPHWEHVERLLMWVCEDQQVPVFFKGNLRPSIDTESASPYMRQWREEFPACYRDGAEIPAVTRRGRLAEDYGWVKFEVRSKK